ncbi:hypothetical protein D9M70_634090 [compost metagenome]
MCPGLPIVIHRGTQQRAAHSQREGNGLRINAIVEGMITYPFHTLGMYDPQVLTALG